MEITVNSAVCSKAGRDKGRFFAVLALQGQNAYLADGELRKIEKPKKKSIKHLSATAFVLDEQALCTNKALRTALKLRFGESVRPQP